MIPTDLKNVVRHENILARMSLVQMNEHGFTKRLHRRNDEQASQLTEFFEKRLVLQNMLNFGGEIEGHMGELFMHGPNNVQRVSRPVQKVWVAEGDVCGTGLHLLSNIR